MIETFLRFVSNYDTGFRDRIGGASDEEIGFLERLIRRPLPVTYVEFLKFMGHSDGGLDLAFDGTTDISEIIDYYRELAEGQLFPPPRDCIVIGTGDPVVGRIYLECERIGEPRVMLGLDGHLDRPYGESWEKVLHRRAFIKYELARMPFSAFYIDRDVRNLVPLAQEIALERDINNLWFSDSEALCAQGESAVLIVERTYRTRGQIKVAARSKQEVQQIGSIFADRLGLQFQRWWQPARRHFV